MKLRSILSISLMAIAGAQAAAAGGLSSEQVKAELREAQRTGNLLAPGELGLPLNQIHPHRYAPVAQVPGKPRHEVREELAQALRTGDIVAGESSLRLNELHPNLYAPMPMVAGKDRQEVKSELAEAIRSGSLISGGELALTRSELSPGRYGGNGSMARGGRSFEPKHGTLSIRF